MNDNVADRLRGYIASRVSSVVDEVVYKTSASLECGDTAFLERLERAIVSLIENELSPPKWIIDALPRANESSHFDGRELL